MKKEPITNSKPGLWHRIAHFKTLFLSLSMASLLAGNVASLVSASTHDWMHSALRQVLSIGGLPFADRALANSPTTKSEQIVKARTADLDTKNRLQARELEELHVKNRKLAQQLDINGKQAKATATAVHQRLAKGVSRNVAALPGESIPYLGLGVTLAVTTLDIYDACQTMQDFNTLLRMMGQGEESPDLCGQKVPTVDQVLASTKDGWESSAQRVAEQSRALKLTAPDVRLPTRDEVMKASCAVTSIPYLCPGK